MTKSLLILNAILILAVRVVFAQPTGDITGEVLDKYTQSFLKEIKVEILGTQIKTETNANGLFTIKNVPPGIYEIRFTNISYQTYIAGSISVSSGIQTKVVAELTPISTEEVIIESLRFQKPVDATVSYKTLTFEELRRFPGGLEDVGRILQSLPGAALTSDGRNDIVVRGGSPSENLFIVDGFLVNNINHFGSQGATGGPVSIINLDFVREVNFLTGGFSAKYGDKLSSVAEIKLKEGNTEKFTGKINLSGTGFGANIEGPLPTKNTSGFIISARRSYLDLIFNASGFSFVPEYTDFQIKAHYHINSRNFLTFSSLGAIDKVRFNNDNEENIQNNERILTNNQNSYSAGLSWKSLWSAKSYSQLILSRNFTNYLFSKRDTNFIETFSNRSKEGDVQLKAEYSIKPTENTYISSGIGGQTILLDYNINKSADTVDITDPQTGKKFVIPAFNLLENKRTYKAFAYAEVIQTLMKRLKFTTGLRYDYIDLINNKNYISPRVSLSLTISPKLTVNTSYGIFYQSPSYIWILGSPSNLNLKDIRADHYIAGIEYLFDESTKLTVEAYYKKYSNYPVSTVRPYLILANNGGFDNQNSFGLEPLISAGKGTAKGFEVFLQKALTKRLYGTFTFSYSDVKYTALDGVERRSDYDNRYIVNASFGYRLGKEWEISGKFRLSGGRPYTPIDSTNGTVDYTKYNSQVLPVYHRLDIRAEKKWNFSKWALTTYIDIQNIYNRKNIFEYRWDKFKREIVKNENLGILPTIGVSAEF
ncbi:MAG: TonB-dependent receptor [Ignavibacteriae bacterium]|nr:MAG: TonB-dependent receptor [Ignavibacteriota bacterium]